ncbi:MAG: hypothetical protein EU529_08135 [Promethearchaeota archaeon]|nr:MAG: hypothetical protein EU529_08135 [Candidatus Lokiarchaeota archaeon]
MSINGFIVLDIGGVPIYSKIIELDIKLNEILLGGFVSAIQSFAKKIISDVDSYIREMKLEKITLLYRQMEIGTFIGLINQESKIKALQINLEYMILAFLLKFHDLLKSKKELDLSVFEKFDKSFLKFRSAKEKELKRWIQEGLEATYLQSLLNNLINYFPIKDLIKLNPKKLTILGKKLIWVNFNITNEEENELIEALRLKTTKVYGEGVFNSIDKNVKEIIKNIEINKQLFEE